MATLFSRNKNRPVNWFENTSRAIHASLPQAGIDSNQMTERLTILLIERLPPKIAISLIDALPEDVRSNFKALEKKAILPADSSIGYSTFIECATQSLGVHLHPDTVRHADLIVSTFLWAVMQDFPPDFKSDLAKFLPSDLKSRMNLYSGHSEQSKVA